MAILVQSRISARGYSIFSSFWTAVDRKVIISCRIMREDFCVLEIQNISFSASKIDIRKVFCRIFWGSKLRDQRLIRAEGVKMGFWHVSGYFLASVELCDFLKICSVCLVLVALFSMRISGSILHVRRHMYLCAFQAYVTSIACC